MNIYWPEEAERQRREMEEAERGCQHDFQEYTGTKRTWRSLFIRPDLICVKCGQISWYPD